MMILNVLVRGVCLLCASQHGCSVAVCAWPGSELCLRGCGGGVDVWPGSELCLRGGVGGGGMVGWVMLSISRQACLKSSLLTDFGQTLIWE